MILDSKKIEYVKIDIAADEAAKVEMRRIAGDPKALPPQLSNGGEYCGVSCSNLNHMQSKFLVQPHPPVLG